ncbi:MAG: hypothetical protein M5U18_08375 [Dehalococcoidia bacterium]|nr:hypothetical protein [Dehalococcoidia bacterium]
MLVAAMVIALIASIAAESRGAVLATLVTVAVLLHAGGGTNSSPR